MLNPDLDLPTLRDEFRRARRIQIQGALRPEVAERLHQCLEREVPWGVAYIDGDQSTLLTADKIAGFTPTDWADLDVKVQARPADRFQFIYNSYMMISAYKERRDPGLLLHNLVEFINAPPFLGLMRTVTGLPHIMRADAQATRYLRGHFLRKHNDQVTNQFREVAYVLNLTKDWQADWGGLLQFVDETGRVTDTLLPIFNSLTLFQVPMWHQVSQVLPHAPHGRYAITGWGMSRPKTA